MLRHAFKKDYSGNTENKLKGVQDKRWDFRQLGNNRGNYNNPRGKNITKVSRNTAAPEWRGLDSFEMYLRLGRIISKLVGRTTLNTLGPNWAERNRSENMPWIWIRETSYGDNLSDTRKHCRWRIDSSKYCEFTLNFHWNHLPSFF